MLHLVGCLYYLYQWCTFKQVSDNEIYLLIKFIKSFVWRVAKRLSYKQDARCLKVKCWKSIYLSLYFTISQFKYFIASFSNSFFLQLSRLFLTLWNELQTLSSPTNAPFCVLCTWILICFYIFRRNHYLQGAYTNVVETYCNKMILQ